MNKLFSFFGLKKPKSNEVPVVVLLLILDIILRPLNALYWAISSITGWQFKGIYVSQRNSIVHAIAQRIVKQYGGEEPPAWAFGPFYTIRCDMLDADYAHARQLGKIFKDDPKKILLGELVRHEQTHCHQWLKEGVLFNYLYTISATHAIRAEAEATVSQFFFYKELADKLEGEEKAEAHAFVDTIIGNAGGQLATVFSKGAVPCKDLLNHSELSLWLTTMDTYIDFTEKFNVNQKVVEKLKQAREEHLDKQLQAAYSTEI